MRKIKFRYWDGDKMHEEVEGTYAWEMIDHDEDECMQFTGLYDKKGVEIYEGDIISCYSGEGEYEYMEVYYNEIEAAFKARNNKWNDLLLEYTTDDLEVIGNVYQNPELLKSYKQ